MFEFTLPDLGEGIHEAEIVQWHVAAGDHIDEDAPLVDVETDKATATIPSPRGGKIVSTVGAAGDTVIVGQVIAVIDDGSQGAAATQAETARKGPPTTKPEAEPAQVSKGAPPSQGASRPPAAPATRRLARELGVDLLQVAPTGPAGRITPEDVRQHAAGGSGEPPEELAPQQAQAVGQAQARGQGQAAGLAPAVSASGIPFLDLGSMPDFERWGPVEREPIRSVRRKIARKMVTTKVVVPHVVHMDEADVTLLEALRVSHNDKREASGEPKVNLLAFVAKAVTAGLKKAPSFNASLDPDKGEIVYKGYYNLGLAADTPKGLLVPVLKDADKRSVLEISSQIRALAHAARSGEITVEDLQGGTFTITNIGPLGGIALAPAINYPEVAILGMGKVQEKPVVRDGEVVIRKMLTLTLSFDHRVADGADAARLVSHIVRLLEDPNALLMEV